MFNYLTPTGTFDLVTNLGLKPGDGLVRMDASTNCELVCEDVADDGLVPTFGCHGMDQCIIDTKPVPCIGEEAECGPCNTPCAASGGTGEPGVGLDATEVTALIEEQAPALIDACIKETLPAMIAEKS